MIAARLLSGGSWCGVCHHKDTSTGDRAPQRARMKPLTRAAPFFRHVATVGVTGIKWVLMAGTTLNQPLGLLLQQVVISWVQLSRIVCLDPYLRQGHQRSVSAALNVKRLASIREIKSGTDIGKLTFSARFRFDGHWCQNVNELHSENPFATTRLNPKQGCKFNQAEGTKELAVNLVHAVNGGRENSASSVHWCAELIRLNPRAPSHSQVHFTCPDS